MASCGARDGDGKAPSATAPSAQAKAASGTGAPEGKQKAAAPREVVKVDLKVGDGTLRIGDREVRFTREPLVAEKGDLVLVTYRGTLTDGKLFDSNDDPEGTPFAFRLGDGGVIQGWEQGIPGMKVGGKRRLEIPSELAYGAQGSPPDIPPNADLVFEVTLLDVVKKGEEGVFDRVDIRPGTGREVRNGDRVRVHYVGRFMNGRQFDSSRERRQPFEFTVGEGMVIPGWDAGILGMRKGGVRLLRLPPGVAYGAIGSGPIPPNQTLFFEIELLEILGPERR